MVMVDVFLNVEDMITSNTFISKLMDRILRTLWWSHPKNLKGSYYDNNVFNMLWLTRFVANLLEFSEQGVQMT